jgi:hypothetical protein
MMSSTRKGSCCILRIAHSLSIHPQACHSLLAPLSSHRVTRQTEAFSAPPQGQVYCLLSTGLGRGVMADYQSQNLPACFDDRNLMVTSFHPLAGHCFLMLPQGGSLLPQGAHTIRTNFGWVHLKHEAIVC